MALNAKNREAMKALNAKLRTMMALKAKLKTDDGSERRTENTVMALNAETKK